MFFLKCIIFLTIINSIFVYSQYNQNTIYLQTSLVTESKVKTNKNCFCVPYWQCKEDFSAVVDDGANLMDVRVLNDEDTNGNASLEEDSGECSGDFDVCCQIQCGKLGTPSDFTESQMNNFAYRILGSGSNSASFGEFPWMLGILHNKVYKCGASLIHPKVAITAAHCVVGGDRFKIRAGEHNWANQNEPLPHQDRYTEKIIIHPRYHAPSLTNDIALLILEKEFKLSGNVGIVCLPSSSQNHHMKTCLASGWGKNFYLNGAYQSTLKKVELPLVPRRVCLESLRNARLGPLFKLHPSFICAGGEHNRDTCKGDGGSPLVCPTSMGHYEQIGIVSWGLSCGLQNTPGVYVNVALYLDWIDQQLDVYNLDNLVYKY